jgi:hypothetical protein
MRRTARAARAAISAGWKPVKVKLSKALKLAIQALAAQQKSLHFDANMHDLQGMDYPLAVSASRQRDELRQALQLLAVELSLAKLKEAPLPKKGNEP